MRGQHDIGGDEAGPVIREEHDYALWEKRVDAMMMLLSQRNYFTVDEARFAMEKLPPNAYENMKYYERWMAGICDCLLRRGIISADEVGRKMAEVEARRRESA
jgi:hypothetical protein